MLKTPLGKVLVMIDDKIVHYKSVPLSTHLYNGQVVNGRYQIEITSELIGESKEIQCILPDSNCDFDVESGELLEAITLYNGSIKLTLGIKSEEDNCNYRISYLSNGLKININNKIDKQFLIFGIAWINQCDDEYDVATWLAADPTIYSKADYTL